MPNNIRNRANITAGVYSSDGRTHWKTGTNRWHSAPLGVSIGLYICARVNFSTLRGHQVTCNINGYPQHVNLEDPLMSFQNLEQEDNVLTSSSL